MIVTVWGVGYKFEVANRLMFWKSVVGKLWLTIILLFSFVLFILNGIYCWSFLIIKVWRKREFLFSRQPNRLKRF